MRASRSAVYDVLKSGMNARVARIELGRNSADLRYARQLRIVHQLHQSPLDGLFSCTFRTRCYADSFTRSSTCVQSMKPQDEPPAKLHAILSVPSGHVDGHNEGVAVPLLLPSIASPS